MRYGQRKREAGRLGWRLSPTVPGPLACSFPAGYAQSTSTCIRKSARKQETMCCAPPPPRPGREGARAHSSGLTGSFPSVSEH